MVCGAGGQHSRLWIPVPTLPPDGAYARVSRRPRDGEWPSRPMTPTTEARSWRSRWAGDLGGRGGALARRAIEPGGRQGEQMGEVQLPAVQLPLQQAVLKVQGAPAPRTGTQVVVAGSQALPGRQRSEAQLAPSWA